MTTKRTTKPRTGRTTTASVTTTRASAGSVTPASPATAPSADEITARVRDRYAAAARDVQAGSSNCGGACSGDVVTGDLYTAEEVAALPEEAVLASLGCGNPTALIDLRAGETVLDLGSGGGIDVLLSARRVGPSGFAYGLDMTEEMLALALQNKAKAGATNVAFLKGRIEEIPLPASSVDVVISNCVINLSANKGQVLREAFRVLKPGGRFAVSDVVADGPVDPALRANMEAWVGCLAGALAIDEYTRLLADAGFAAIDVSITRRYTAVEAGLDPNVLPEGWQAGDGKLASAFVRARKPASPGVASSASSTGTSAPAPASAPTRALPVASGGSGCCGTGGSCGK
jgi:arsenite methyltransferase